MTNTSFAAEWLELEKVFGGRFVLKGGVDDLRAQFAGLGVALATQIPPPDESVLTEDIEFKPGRKVRIYQPSNRKCKDLPVCISFHSGGFVIGNLDFEDPVNRIIATEINSVVISVDYGLAPEHRAPVALDDAVDAVLWSISNVAAYGGNAQKIYTCGSSAGGNLAFSVALKLHDMGKGELVKGIVSLGPCTVHPDALPEKYRDDYNSYIQCHDAPVINADTMKTFYDTYGATPEDVYLSPLLHPKLGNLPRVYITAAGLDPLRDDARVMAKALTEAGVNHRFVEYPGYPHCFWNFPGLEIGKKFISDMLAGISYVLEA
ncbi:hypothetical protein RUND412_007530 [Rhizina undulata]